MIELACQNGYHIRRIILEDDPDQRVFGLFDGEHLVGLWADVMGPFNRLDKLINITEKEI